MLADWKGPIEKAQDKLQELQKALDITGKEDEATRLEALTAEPGFWDDQEAAQGTLQKLTMLKAVISNYHSLSERLEDVHTLWELGTEEGDESLAKEVEHDFNALSADLEKLEIEVLFSGPYDDHNCILSLHAGAGGTEAQDWADMLYRMYTRFCEKNGFKCEVMDFLDGEEAGLKSVTLSIEGPHAYGHFRSEKGVHRLVRISPFDASARRHTSFASLDVMPQVQEDNEITINPDELKIDTYRSGGAGGQHVNKTDSAVRITHLPTGIVVQCQDERSQFNNKDRAMKLLKARLLEEKVKERERELAALKGEQTEIGWGNQIRSYVFQPYRLVKDHRTGVESGNVDAVMDGDLLPFMSGYLKEFKG
ncbi:MAG: peptide chain release factor 2 [Firmicutes bacterium]|nr:peptide chain release factor 2 [Bacillota bacterium]